MSLARRILRRLLLAKVQQIVDREYPDAPRKVRIRMAREAAKEARKDQMI